MKIKINKCKECPMHYSESEFPAYTCQVIRRNLFPESKRETFPEWCPLLKGTISVSIDNVKEVVKRIKEERKKIKNV